MRSASGRDPLVILGAVGNCLDIVDAVRAINLVSPEGGFEIVGFLDDDPERLGQSVAGIPVLGPLADAARIEGARFVNGIGSPRSFRGKPDMLARTGVAGTRFSTVVHPDASVSASAELGAGCVVLANVTVCANVRIGDHVMILPNAVIGHDSTIGDHSTLAASVVVSGFCRIGQCCYLGAGACVRDGVAMGDGSLLGMGSVLLRDMPEQTVYVGNPARPLSKTSGGRDVNRPGRGRGA